VTNGKTKNTVKRLCEGRYAEQTREAAYIDTQQMPKMMKKKDTACGQTGTMYTWSFCKYWSVQRPSTIKYCLKQNIKYLPPRSVLCVVVVTMSAYSNGEGMTCAATRPEMCAMSANNTAFTSSQICNITTKTTFVSCSSGHSTFPAFSYSNNSHAQPTCRDV